MKKDLGVKFFLFPMPVLMIATYGDNDKVDVMNMAKKKDEFKTSKELREDAYLKLDTMFLRGVINWEEVQFEELPDAVKTKYQE